MWKDPPKTRERVCQERKAAADGFPRAGLSPKIVTAACITVARLSGQAGTSLPEKDAVPLSGPRAHAAPGSTTPVSSWPLEEKEPAGADGAQQPRGDQRTRVTWGWRTFGGTTKVLNQIFLQLDIKPLLPLGFKLSKSNSSLPWCFGGGITHLCDFLRADTVSRV